MFFTLYYASINFHVGNSDGGSEQSTEMCVMRAINQKGHNKLLARIVN